MSKKTGTIIKFVSLGVAVVLLIVLLWLMLDKGKEPEQIAYSGDEVNSLTSLIENGDARAVFIVNGSEAYVLVNGSETSYESFKADPTSNADYVAELPGYSVFFDYVHSLEGKGDFVMPEITTHYYSGVSWTSFIFPAIMLIIMCVVLYIIFRQSAGANKQAMNFGKTKARVSMNVPVRFSDVAGAEEEKEELKEIVDFLKNPQKFSAVGARIPKGVLLVGPPGTGKTLFAKAVAGESNVPFFSISGSDFVEMFVGTGAARVRDLFDQAKRNMPCIVFIDEI